LYSYLLIGSSSTQKEAVCQRYTMVDIKFINNNSAANYVVNKSVDQFLLRRFLDIYPYINLNNSMLSDKLKEETKTNHQILERALVGQLKAIRSKEEYARLLKLFYGYFGGLETQINQHINAQLLPDNEERRKTQALANDLQFLGSDVPAKADGNALPTIHTPLQALGALYVIEGSTLGGKIISKMMQQQLALTGGGLSFFAGYRDRSMEMWDTFKEALNSQAENPEQEAVVIAAANETFLKFGEWFEKRD
jgi:heme oxygenase